MHSTTALTMRAEGFNILAALPRKKFPMRTWKEFQSRLQDPEEIPEGDFDPLLVTGFGTQVALYVIDVDDITQLQWVIETFGDTPLKVQSGRSGGGIHLYYRGAPGLTGSVVGQIGPDIHTKTLANGKVRHYTKIDVKGTGGVVVFPGARHKSGLVYHTLGTVEWTAAWILSNVPEFNIEVLKSARESFSQATRKNHIKGTVSSDSETHEGFEDLVIQAADGQSLTWAQAVSLAPLSVFCPFCGDANTPSAMVYPNDGSPVLTCFSACSKTYRPVRRDVSLGRAVLLEAQGEAAPEAPRNPGEPPRCPELPDAPVVVNAYPMGTGKTYQAKRAVEGQFVIAIGPTQALCAKLAEDFKINSYADLPETIKRSSDTGFAICPPSLHRIETETLGDYTLIIDEADQIFDLLHADAIMGKKKVTLWYTFAELVERAKRVIVADAFASDRVVRELARMGASKPTVMLPPRDFKALQGHREVKVPSAPELLGHILLKASQGQRGVVSCDAKSTARTIAYAIRARVPDARVWLFTGDSPKSEKDLLRNATRHIEENYDWFVYTQAAGSGVSLEMEGWCSFAHGTSHSGTNGPQLRQLSARLRNPKDKVRYSCIRKVTRDNDTDFTDYLPKQLRVRDREAKLTGYTGTIVPSGDHQDFIGSEADSRWYSGLHSRDCHNWYYDTLVLEGAEILETLPVAPATLKALETLWEEARELSEAEANGEKWAAPKVPDLVARKIQPDSHKEVAMAARHWIINHWGLLGLTDPFIGDYGRDELKAASRRYNDFRLLAAGHEGKLKARSADKAVYQDRFFAAQISPRIQAAQGILKSLEAAGVTLDPECFWAGDCNLAALVKIHKEYDMETTIGIPEPKTQGAKYVNLLLGRMGLKARRGKRNKVRGYCLDVVWLEIWNEACQRSFDRAMGITVPDVSELDNNPSYWNTCGDWDLWRGTRDRQEALANQILEFRRHAGPFAPLPHEIEFMTTPFSLDVDKVLDSLDTLLSVPKVTRTALEYLESLDLPEENLDLPEENLGGRTALECLESLGLDLDSEVVLLDSMEVPDDIDATTYKVF